MNHRYFVFFFVLLLSYPLFAQTVNTGNISIQLNGYGRMRMLMGDDATRQIDRFSILVARDANSVFDYFLDAENEVPAAAVTPATYGDIEASVTINHTYSNLPPATGVEINVYGWNNEYWVLARCRVENRETATYTARVGYEFIPQLGGVYGNEALNFDADSQIVYTYRDSFYVGYKMLSGNLSQANFMDWYDSYQADTLFYRMMTTGTFDGMLQTGGDGGVGIFSGQSFEFAAAAKVDVWVAMAHGKNLNDLRTALSDAKTAYSGITTDVNDPVITPAQFALFANYPNPFNPATTIRYAVDQTKNIRLAVYDAMGAEVAVLVNEIQTEGEKEIRFNGQSLSSGIYYLRLTDGVQSFSQKMILMK